MVIYEISHATVRAKASKQNLSLKLFSVNSNNRGLSLKGDRSKHNITVMQKYLIGFCVCASEVIIVLL